MSTQSIVQSVELSNSNVQYEQSSSVITPSSQNLDYDKMCLATLIEEVERIDQMLSVTDDDDLSCEELLKLNSASSFPALF